MAGNRHIHVPAPYSQLHRTAGCCGVLQAPGFKIRLEWIEASCVHVDSVASGKYTLRLAVFTHECSGFYRPLTLIRIGTAGRYMYPFLGPEYRCYSDVYLHVLYTLPGRFCRTKNES